MKKRLCHFLLNIMSISLLFPAHSALGNNSKASQDEFKKLNNKYVLFKKAGKELEAVTEAYDTCEQNKCLKEKEAFHVVSQQRVRPQAYRNARRIYQICMQEQCSAEYKRYHQALNSYTNKIVGLLLGIYAGVIGGVLLLVGTTVVASNIVAKKRINQLIKKYDLDDDQVAVLKAFWQSRNMKPFSNTTIKEPLHNAMAEVYFGRQPNEQEIGRFNEWLNQLNVTIKPDLR